MYSHDGLKDSLTNLAAPPFFYEELRRGLSRVARSDGQLSLIRLVLSVDIEDDLAETMTYPDDLEILQFADILVRLTRIEDLCARIGEKEFIVLLYGGESVAHGYVERILMELRTSRAVINIDDDSFFLRLGVSHSSSRVGQSALDLLQDLDHEPLLTGRT